MSHGGAPIDPTLTDPPAVDIDDFDKYEVHKGTSAGFTPDAGTLVG